jgi:hypothetical protein
MNVGIGDVREPEAIRGIRLLEGCLDGRVERHCVGFPGIDCL